MDNERKPMTADWNWWQWGLAGLGAGAVLWWLMRMIKNKEAPAAIAGGNGTNGTTNGAAAMTLEQKGADLASRYIVRGARPCEFTWAAGASASSFAAHSADFVQPAVQAAGTKNPDALAAKLMGLVLPGCGKPTAIASFDLDRAIAGELSSASMAAFNAAKLMPPVQLYLMLRGLAAAAVK